MALAAPTSADGPIIRYECTYRPIGDEWWNIPSCQPSATPWITVGQLGHSGLKLFCPDAAPFSYQNMLNGGIAFAANSTDWQRLSKWISWPTVTSDRCTGDGHHPDWDVGYKGRTLIPADFTPGWVDAFVINDDPLKKQSWRFAIGCSAINAVADPDGAQVGPIPGGQDGAEGLGYDNVVAAAGPTTGARAARASGPRRRGVTTAASAGWAPRASGLGTPRRRRRASASRFRLRTPAAGAALAARASGLRRRSLVADPARPEDRAPPPAAARPVPDHARHGRLPARAAPGLRPLRGCFRPPPPAPPAPPHGARLAHAANLLRAGARGRRGAAHGVAAGATICRR